MKTDTGGEMGCKEKNMEIKNTQQAEVTDSVSTRSASIQAESIAESRRRFAKTGLAASGVLLTLASRSALGAGLSPSGFISGNVSQQGATTSSLGSSIKELQDANGAWNGIEPSKDFAFIFGVADPAKYGCYIKYKSLKNQKYIYQLSNSTNDTFVKYTLLDVLNQKHVGYYALSISGNPKTGNSEINKDKNNTCYKPILNTAKCSKDNSYRDLSADNYAISELGQHCVAALINSRAGKTPYLPESTIKEMFNKCISGQAFNPTVGVDWYANDCVKYLKTTWSA
ncbi:MAG: hypothetical protein ABL885_05545 [Methylophilaceae bacterium]